MTDVNTPLLGVNITDNLSSAVAVVDRGLKVGTRVLGVDGTEFELVKAGSAITVYDCVAIDENRNAWPMTKARADDGWAVGFAQTALTKGNYGCVARHGSNIKCRLAKACAPDVALYTTATGGVLDDESSAQTNIDGVVAVTTASASGVTPIEVIATSPRSTTF